MKTLNLFLLLLASLILLSYIVNSVNINLTPLSATKMPEQMNNNHNDLLNHYNKDKLHKASINKADYEVGNYKQQTNHSCYMYKDRLGAIPSDMNTH
jgi:hypothetical protein